MSKFLHYCNTGKVGGSEEAVIYLSIELAKLGHNVVIFGDPSAADDGKVYTYGNGGGVVRWYRVEDFDISVVYDAFIAWRYAQSLSLGKSSIRRMLWLHDLVMVDSIPIPVRYEVIILSI